LFVSCSDDLAKANAAIAAKETTIVQVCLLGRPQELFCDYVVFACDMAVVMHADIAESDPFNLNCIVVTFTGDMQRYITKVMKSSF